MKRRRVKIHTALEARKASQAPKLLRRQADKIGDSAAVRREANTRADKLRLLQQAHGNAYVQHRMRVTTTALQRKSAAPAASATVPGLSQEAVTQIESRLRDNRPGALDALSAALVKRGDIDTSFLAGGKMTYVGDNSGMSPDHYGHTSLKRRQALQEERERIKGGGKK